MNDYSEWVDYGPELNVGAQSDGTYSVPAAAQPNNVAWDTGGGFLGQYGDDVFSILREGVGAWAQYQRNNQFLDYQRFEATQGGLYRQGVPAGQMRANGAVQVSGNNNMLMILLVVGAVLLLRK